MLQTRSIASASSMCCSTTPAVPQCVHAMRRHFRRSVRAHLRCQRQGRVLRLSGGHPASEGAGRRRDPEHGVQHARHPARPGLAAYNASKAAVINLTKTLALELAPHHIRVVSLCPVATDTPMLQTFLGTRRRASPPTLRRHHPLGPPQPPDRSGQGRRLPGLARRGDGDRHRLRSRRRERYLRIGI